MSLSGSACARLTPDGGDSDAVSDKVPARIRAELTAKVEQDLIVMLAPASDDPDENVQASAQALANDLDEIPRDAEAQALADALVEERAELYAKLQSKVLSAVRDYDALELKIQYTNLPFLLMHVKNHHGLEALASQPEVARIYENTQFEHALTQSLAQIHQPQVAAAGRLGANTAVAVLDTGCDYKRAAFGSCSAPGGKCKVAYAADFAPNDNSLDDHGHGTNVAGIVLGVAPSTKILALDVFKGDLAPGSAILQAIDWSISKRSTYNIVAMNMSLGGGNFNAPCTTDYFAAAIANARSAGILAAIASGNNGFTSSISSPACSPAAISVGAVYDASFGGISYSACTDWSTAADKVTCFSNSASFLSVLAPGAAITAAGITMTGTSQATPHVAGALAVLRSAFPSEALSATVARVTDTGPEITDPRNGVVKRRLDLAAAVSGAAAGSGDTTPPTGSVTIQAGATAVKTGTVTLAINATDPSGTPQMCVSNTESCSSFIPFAASKSWSLTSGDGVKTVYVTVRDGAGNVAKFSDTIVRDAAIPMNPVLTPAPGDSRIDLSWTAGADAASGVASYKLVYAAGNAPVNCNAGAVLYAGTLRTFAHVGLVNGMQYSYRVCAVDAAANMSTGATASARPAPEREGPVGSVLIASGAEYAKSTAVSLILSATDDSGVTSMCISNTKTCTSWIAYARTKTWTLSTAGVVYAWFRDAWGNVSASPATDGIVIDKTPPTLGSFLAVASVKSVSFLWTQATDTQSGVASYRLVWAKATTAPSCTAGAVAYSGPLGPYTHTGLVSGAKYSYRLCALDAAGNISTGLTRTVTVK